MAEDCVDPFYLENVETSKVKLRPTLKPEKQADPDCQLFLAHGPAMTKVRVQIIDVSAKFNPSVPDAPMTETSNKISWIVSKGRA